MKLGILLGSFDPIHIGHLCMAQNALNENLVDNVIFVPAYQNPWKSKSTDYGDRYCMTKFAIKNMKKCSISNIELDTPEPHYTSDTLKYLKEIYPNDELYLLMGEDVYNDISKWYEGEWILSNFKFIMYSRNVYNISSTEIRNLIKENKQIYPLVPESVCEYIAINNLYK